MVMKVAMIADYPDNTDKIDGGVQAVTSYLVDALAQIAEIELHILSFKLDITRTTVLAEPRFVRYLIPYSKFGTLTNFREDQANLNALLNEIRPDIIHSQGGGHQGTLASRSGYPTVVTIHGILRQEARLLSGLRRRWRTRLQSWLGERHYIRHATHTILINPYVADHYNSALSGEKYLIPNPVDPRFFKISRREVPGKILFAGRLYMLKGVKDLLHAAAIIANRHKLRIVLAGSLSDADYVSDLRLLADRLNLSQIVEFRGILRTEELLTELSECAALVLPSYQETAPMVIQEAMAAGVPIVASNICGIPYQIDDQKMGFLFPPGNIDALADNLDRLLSNKLLRKQFGAAARLKAMNEYKSETIAQQTMAVYREICQQRDANDCTKPQQL